MAEERIEIKKSTVWMIGGLLGGLLLTASIFTGGFGITGNAIAVKSKNGISEVTTTLQGFQYNPDVITVKNGDTVKLTINNKDDVDHGLHLPQFGIVEGIPSLSTKTVQFLAIETPTNGQAVPTCSQEHGETLTINVI